MSCKSLGTVKMRNVWKTFSSITAFLLQNASDWSEVGETQNHEDL